MEGFLQLTRFHYQKDQSVMSWPGWDYLLISQSLVAESKLKDLVACLEVKTFAGSKGKDFCAWSSKE